MFSIPSALRFCSPCLVAEAVGQLAAWSAMAAVDFRVRPLAGIAGAVRVPSEVRPGELLDLRVEIERCDDSAVAYGGSATSAGTTVLELEGCVGPMFPLEDYDSREALMQRFETLRGAGESADRFETLDRGTVEVIDHEPGERISAELHVPRSAAFFADHFPRRPVFPATLLLDHQIELALTLAADAFPVRPVRLTDIANAKMRSFVLPGWVVQLEATLESAAEPRRMALAARADGKRVSTARAMVSAGTA